MLLFQPKPFGALLHRTSQPEKHPLKLPPGPSYNLQVSQANHRQSRATPIPLNLAADARPHSGGSVAPELSRGLPPNCLFERQLPVAGWKPRRCDLSRWDVATPASSILRALERVVLTCCYVCTNSKTRADGLNASFALADPDVPKNSVAFERRMHGVCKA